MQADGRLIQHITDPLQIRAELRSQANPLSFTPRQRRCRAVQLQIPQPHAIQKPQARPQFRQQIAGNCRFPRVEVEFCEEFARPGDRLARQMGDRTVAEAHVECDRAQALARAGTAGDRLVLVPIIPPDLLAALLLIEARHLHAGSVAALAPAVLGVEREQAWVQLGKAATA